MLNIKKKIHKINSNNEGKILFSNFGYLSLLQIASYIFPLITIPYLARIIGVEGFGKIAFAAAIIVWFQTISDWGFNYTATRDIAKNRDDKKIVSEIFSNVLWARCALMFFSFLILLLLIYFIPKFKENQTIIFITFLTIPGHIMFPEWFFQALERMKYITILIIISKILSTVAVFIFIQEKSDYFLQPLFISLGYLISGVIAMYYILVRWEVKLCRPMIRKVVNTIKSSTDVFINNIMPNLYNSFSFILLGFYGENISNGLLEAGSKFVNIAQQFLTVISRTFFPFLSRRIDKHDLFRKLNFYTAAIISVILYILAPILIKLFFTTDFNNATIVLRILSFSILFMALSNIYGTNYMIIEGYEKQLRNITFLSSVIGFILSFPLIIMFDFIGAAIIISLSRVLLGVSIMWKVITIKKKLKRK